MCHEIHALSRLSALVAQLGLQLLEASVDPGDRPLQVSDFI